MPSTEKRILVVAASCCILILAAMICYPAGYDQSAFRIGGNLVREGAVPFRDFLDTKPPVIFYIYALATTIFGDHDAAIRIFDALYQLAAMWLFFRLLERNGLSRTVSSIAVLINIMIYAGTGYWMTAQAETFALVPILLSINIGLSFEKDRTALTKRGLLLGLLGVLLFLLKYTLLTIPIGTLIWLFTRDTISLKEKVRFSIITFAGLALGLAAFVGLFSMIGGLDTWLESLTWLGGYSSIESLLSFETVADRYLRLFQMVLVEVFSLSVIVCAAVGLYVHYGRKERGRMNSIIVLCSIHLGIGLLATIYERKFFHYHYLKVLWAFAPIAAIGLIEVVRLIAASWKSSPNFIKRVLILGAVAAFCFYSPLLSLRQPIRWPYYRIAGINEAEILDQKEGYFPLKEMQLIEKELRPQLKAEDTIFFWGNHVQIYSLLGKRPTTICLTNTPLSTAWTPQSWTAKLQGQLREQRPEYLIIEKGDYYTFINGSDKDSRDRFFADPFFSSYASQYDSLYGTSHFDVYKMRSPL